MLKYNLSRLVYSLILFLTVMLSFFVVYLSLLAFFIPLAVVLLLRRILSMVFLVFYNGKYKLVDSSDSVYAAWNSFGNVSNLTLTTYVDGPCDINKLRERIRENILQRDENGTRPYGNLLNSFVEKFSFLCLTDCSSTIDFNHHIKLCPGIENSSKINKEHEIFDVVAKLVDDEWPEGKPKWEILIAPNVRSKEREKTYSIVYFKVHHFYMDGISIHQFLRNCIADQPALPLLLDPVNPPVTRVPLLQKMISALQCLLLEPYLTLRIFWNTTDRFPCEKAIGGKMIGRSSSSKISQEAIRRIRRFHKCSTEAVFHSAFLGSLQKMAVLKGIQIAPQTIAAKVCANFPYPNEFPINLVHFGYQLIKTDFKDPIERLNEMNKFIVSVNHRHYALRCSLILTRISGWYPMPVLRYFVQFFKPCYYLTNVPGLPENLTLQGNNIEFVSGFPPLCNGIGFTGVTGFYRGRFATGFLVNKSALIENREDMDAWIAEYENEIHYLEMASVAK